MPSVATPISLGMSDCYRPSVGQNRGGWTPAHAEHHSRGQGLPRTGWLPPLGQVSPTTPYISIYCLGVLILWGRRGRLPFE